MNFTAPISASYLSSGGPGSGWEGGLFIATTSMTGVITTLILCSIFMHVRRRQRKHALRRARVPQPRYAFYYPGWSAEDDEEGGGEGRWQDAAELALEEPTELPRVPYYSPLAASMVQRTPLASPGLNHQQQQHLSPLTSLGPELAGGGSNEEEEAQDVELEEEDEEPLALNAKEEEEAEAGKGLNSALQAKKKEREEEEEALGVAAALYEAQLEDALAREAAEQEYLATLPGLPLRTILPAVICTPFLCGGGGGDGGGMEAVEDTHRPHYPGPQPLRGDEGGRSVGEGRGEQQEFEEEEEEWEEDDAYEQGTTLSPPTHPPSTTTPSAAITPRPPIHRFHPRNSNSSERRRRRRALDGGDIFPLEAAYEPPLLASPPPPPSLWSSMSCSGEGGVGVENTHLPTSPNNPRSAHFHHHQQQQQQQQLQLQHGSFPLSISPYSTTSPQHHHHHHPHHDHTQALEQRALALRAYVHPSLSLTTSPAPAKKGIDPMDVSSSEPNPTATPSPPPHPHPNPYPAAAAAASPPLSEGGGLSDRVGGAYDSPYDDSPGRGGARPERTPTPERIQYRLF